MMMRVIPSVIAVVNEHHRHQQRVHIKPHQSDRQVFAGGGGGGGGALCMHKLRTEEDGTDGRHFVQHLVNRGLYVALSASYPGI